MRAAEVQAARAGMARIKDWLARLAPDAETLKVRDELAKARIDALIELMCGPIGRQKAANEARQIAAEIKKAEAAAPTPPAPSRGPRRV